MENKAPIGAGIEDFKRLREEGYVYVDKTALIKLFLENPCSVALFTRPRRFGKTLALSMLQHFFEIGTDPTLFNGLEIMESKSLIDAHMGKYPVVSISLKDVQGTSIEMARSNFALAIRTEARRLRLLSSSSILSNKEKQEFEWLEGVQGDDKRLHESLLLLTQLLEKHFGKRAILLIDEYDAPLDASWQYSYYEEMLAFIRSLFSLSLKGNNSLQHAILTGCLRVSKESIFTGVNNFRPFSITHPRYSSCFGFTELETRELLGSRGLLHRLGEAREWYDGYNFAGTQLFCPWDIICFCDDAIENSNSKPQPYWMNTSENSIIRKLADMAGQAARIEIGELIEGGTIEKDINEQLTYSSITQTIDNVWSVMHATGYLTALKQLESGKYTLALPNKSVQQIFTQQVNEWFAGRVASNNKALSALRSAIADGNGSAAQLAANDLLADFISSRDYAAKESRKESFYHGLLLGALADLKGWTIASNEESGYGFWDIAAKNRNLAKAFIIEVKYAESESSLESASAAAIKQIEARQYWRKLVLDRAREIMLYGASFHKKECCISYKMLEPGKQ